MQVENKIFEVDRIVCHRQYKGKEEFLVYWKGFENSTATWEPVENLLSCGDLIEQFHRQAIQIPGANPYQIFRTSKAKTVHVKMLLTRKNKHKRKMDTIQNEKSMTPPYRKKGLSESEKLIRDTLLHESKTMKPENTCLNKINGLFERYENTNENNNNNNNTSAKPMYNGPQRKIYGRKSISDSREQYYGGRSDINSSQNILCTIDKGYMTITMNNTRRHNVLTIDMLDTMRDHMLKAQKDPNVKAILICSNDDYFCSGIDYTDLIDCTDDKAYKYLVNTLVSTLRNFLLTLLSSNKPLVCGVNGPALEFGMVLVILSDFSYSNAKASFDLLFNKLDLTPVGCVTHLLPKIVGRSLAHSMLYLGGHYSAVTTFDRGLVLDMFGVNSFNEDIEKKMTQLATNSTHVLEATKKLVRFLELETLEEICNEELTVYQQMLTNKDVRKKLKEDWRMRINLFGDI